MALADSRHWYNISANFRLHKFTVISIEDIKSSKKNFAVLVISIFLHGKIFHHLILLHTWYKIS